MRHADWRAGLPRLVGARTAVREVSLDDAASLVPELSADRVREHIPQPPNTIEVFRHFAEWAIRERVAGKGMCFAVMRRDDGDAAVGLMAVRAPTAGFELWNLGFIFVEGAWGKGLCADAARVILAFASEAAALSEVEAWTLSANLRAQRTLARLGGTPETRPASLAPDGRTADHVRWLIRTS